MNGGNVRVITFIGKRMYIPTTDSSLDTCGIRTHDLILRQFSPAAGGLAAVGTRTFRRQQK